MYQKMKHYLILSAVLCLFDQGCISSNYYTGRTLKNGESVLTPSADNLIVIEEDKGISEKQFGLSPSLGYARGLPWQFEAGIRFHFPYVFEIILRKQLNPESFKLFDISANLHSGVNFPIDSKYVSPPFFKYGLTVSKEIGTIQPYLGYYFINNYNFNREEDIMPQARSISIGIGFKYKKDLVLPEINYFRLRDKGIFSFGIGIRAFLGN